MPFDDQGDTHLVQLRDCCHQAADELEKRADKIGEVAAFLEGLAGRIDPRSQSCRHIDKDELEKDADACRAQAGKLRGET